MVASYGGLSQALHSAENANSPLCVGTKRIHCPIDEILVCDYGMVVVRFDERLNLWKACDPEVWLGLQVATECLGNIPWVNCLLRLLLELLLLLLLEGALLLEASLLLSEVLLEVERLLLLRLRLLLERLLWPLLEALLLLLLLSWRLRRTECSQGIPELRRVEECVYPVDERLEEGA